MNKSLVNISGSIGLSNETLRRAALILQGPAGSHIRSLKFSKDPDQRDNEIQEFLDAINQYFANLIQFVYADEFIVPIVINPKACEVKRRSLPSPVVAIGFIILLYSFSHKVGPTLKNLEEYLQISKVSLKKLPRTLNQLLELRWITLHDDGIVKRYDPTNVLRASIPPSMVDKVLILMKKNPEQRNHILSLLPKDYMDQRRQLRISKQISLDLFASQSKKYEEGSSNE